MRVRITAGKHMMHAKFVENETSRKLYECLPLTVSMMNLYGSEMCYRMGNGNLPVEETEKRECHIGDIFYWPPAGSLIILYGQNRKESERILIGHIEEDISFFQKLNDTEFTFEKEDV